MGFERRKVAWESNTDECRETGGEGGGENRVCVERSARARARAASTGFRWSRGCVGMKRVDGNCVLSSTSGYAECLLRLRRVIG